jgi:hypothetical protein
VNDTFALTPAYEDTEAKLIITNRKFFIISPCYTHYYATFMPNQN